MVGSLVIGVSVCGLSFSWVVWFFTGVIERKK